jgi:hypothetical protein
MANDVIPPNIHSLFSSDFNEETAGQIYEQGKDVVFLALYYYNSPLSFYKIPVSTL